MIQPSDLKTCPLFNGLNEDELLKISSITEKSIFPKGSLVVRQDTSSDFFYTVLEGEVRVYRSVAKENDIEIATLKKGSFFGEMAILDGSKRSVNVETLEDSVLIMISREDFLNEIWRFPTIVAKLLKGLSIRIRKTDETFIQELQKKNAMLENLIRELKKVDEMKSKFFSLASHELRTPLGVILMTLPLLEKAQGTKSSKKSKLFFEGMERQLLRLGDMIRSILKASESSEGAPEDKKVKENVNNLVRMACSDLNYFFEIRSLKLTVELSPEIQEIYLHTSKFYQVILNLLMNAIRFTPDGGSIKIKTEKEDSNIVLSVSDSGIGIEGKHFNDIFKPFYIIGSELKHSSGTYQFMSGGLGLGLTITKKFVEFHNGKIKVESQKNAGTTFTVTLPI